MKKSFGRCPIPEITHHRHRKGVPLIGQFFGHLGKFKRNPVAFLGPDIVGVGAQFLGFVPATGGMRRIPRQEVRADRANGPSE